MKLLSPGSFPECSQCSAPGLSEVLSELSTLEGVVRARQHPCAQTRQLQENPPRNFAAQGSAPSILESKVNLAEILQAPEAWKVTEACPAGSKLQTSAGPRFHQCQEEGSRWYSHPTWGQQPSIGCAHPQGARQSSQLLPASALHASGQVHRCVPAPLPARRAQPPPWASALLLQGTVRAQPVSAGPSCQVFPSATAPFPLGLGLGE